MSEGEARKLLERWRALTEQCLSSPDRAVFSLDLLLPGERESLAAVPNPRPYELERSVVDLFLARAGEHPEALAVESPVGRLTYGQLLEKVSAVAASLRERGIGPGERVGLYMGSTPLLPAALLGVMAAGAAYVPLDADDPLERTTYIIEDAGIGLVLVDDERSEHLASAGIFTLAIAEAAAANSAAPPAGVGEVAYVAYTSGSSGRPKGAVISHRALTNYLMWTHEWVFERVDWLPAVTKISFDACLKQLLGPLIGGRAVWMLAEGAASRPLELIEAVGSRRRVGLNCVPTLWGAILDEIEAGQSPPAQDTLEAVLLGGERITPGLLARTTKLVPWISVFNLYGPTEATANATVAAIAPGEPITIGQPIANMRAMVADSDLGILPPGAPGEILIGGPGLAEGYLNRPELTDRVFVEIDSQPGVRFYRSGDCGLLDDSGRLHYLGRLDSQVKIRGYRVELGEIEAALEQCEGVRECAVCVVERPVVGPQLMAFAVADGDLSPRSVRASLRQALPTYMLPGKVVQVDRLPRLSNGKLDRMALIQLEREEAA
jgi:amino acid adenylation domain-containing protein